MLPNPKHPLTHVEKLVYGEAGQRHPVTGYPIECGYGAGTPQEQAERLHIPMIEALAGKEVANTYRRKLGLPIAEEVAAENERLQKERDERLKAAYAALAEKEAGEAQKAQESTSHPLSPSLLH
jgi:hypothetical protein